MRVLVTGATGLVGRALCRALLEEGHAVLALSRREAPPGLPPGAQPVRGDPTVPGPWQEALAGCDACVNLAGEPMAAGRWNEARKRAIHQSRVQATRNVAAVVAERGPSVLVSGSAIGFYGPRGDEVLDESAPPGSDFLSRSCVEWEGAAAPAARRARVVLLRSGLVLAREGGALPRMALPFRLFGGGPLGDGSFWQSWIHLADEVGLIAWALREERAVGPLNGTAPAPVRNRDLARALGRALHRPSFLPAPRLAIRAMVGEMADVVLTGQRVVPAKAVALGHRFRFPDLDGALADLYRS
ncbi:MAG TPA: TIGR01777 family oxidoreductase [Anaeromyxobacteraceae bacterium]|nr:TIGR01777 family oxidoreductase [Anaeromyxobacteraceae bacterium]